MVVLIDTNIIIDYLIKRADFKDSETIIDNYCTEGKVSGVIAAHSVPDIFYILRKDFSNEERRRVLLNILTILDVSSIDKSKLVEALSETNFIDFEDCLQSKCAEEIYADYIITRNPKDFEKSMVPVISPGDFVNLMENDTTNSSY